MAESCDDLKKQIFSGKGGNEIIGFWISLVQTNFRSKHLDLDYNIPDKCKRKTVCYDDDTLYICVMCHLLHSFNKLRITKMRHIAVVLPTKECIRLNDLLYYVYASFKVCEWQLDRFCTSHQRIARGRSHSKWCPGFVFPMTTSTNGQSKIIFLLRLWNYFQEMFSFFKFQ